MNNHMGKYRLESSDENQATDSTNEQQPSLSFNDVFADRRSIQTNSSGQAGVADQVPTTTIPPGSRSADTSNIVPGEIHQAARSAADTGASPALRGEPNTLNNANFQSWVNQYLHENPPHKQQWTLAIELATNVTRPGNPQPVKGAERQMKEIEALAAQTKDKPVTIVAQCARADGSKILDTYIIKDGHITKAPPHHSDNIEHDITNLMKLANTLAPAEKLGLMILSHGQSTRGILGDNGKASLDELKHAIATGLQGSGHSELDLLDLDACIMGNTNVLDKLSGSAHQIVASEDYERLLDGNVDGQRLEASISSLLRNPQMSADQFAEQIIKLSDQGINDADGATGTTTLAHFNLDRYRDFKASLGGFGEALRQAIALPGNLDVVNLAISNTQLVPGPALGSGLIYHQNRDVKQFAENIEKAINEGKLSDPNGKLARTTAQFLQNYARMTESYHGTPNTPYEKLGGLAIFLPDVELTDTQVGTDPALAILMNRPDSVASGKKKLDPKDANFPLQMRSLSELVDGMKDSLPADKQKELKPLQQACQQLANAKDESECRQIMLRVQQLANGLRYSVNSTLAERRSKKEQASRDSMYDEEIITPNAGWNSFLDSLRR